MKAEDEKDWESFVDTANKWAAAVRSCMSVMIVQAKEAGEEDEINVALYNVALDQLAANASMTKTAVAYRVFQSIQEEQEEEEES